MVTSWDAPSPNPDLPVDRIVSLHHFSDTLTTCLVLEGGDIVIVQESEDSSPQDGVHIEIMGSIDDGITAARWSPDEELLAIATKANTVVFMSRSFEGITDATMTADDLILRMQLARLLALSYHEPEVTIDIWKKTRTLELERKAREATAGVKA